MKLYRNEKDNAAEVLEALNKCDTISYNRRKNTFTFYAHEGALLEDVENADSLDLVKLANALEKRYFFEATIGCSAWNWDDEEEEDEQQEDEPKAEDQATETKKEDKHMKKRFFYLADIGATITIEQITKKELLSIADGLKNYTTGEHYDVIWGYTKDGKAFYYDCTNFDSFKKSDIIDAVSVVYSSEECAYYWGGFYMSEYGIASPTTDGSTTIQKDENIKEVETADYSETAEEPAAEEPAADQAEETTTLKNYDEVRETLIETIADLETRKNRYQTDIYLYIDENGHGTIDTFANVGGNSWLNDDHITIYTDREHYETKLDDLQNGDGRGAWNWLIDELENAYNLTGIKEKIYNLCCDDDDDAPSFKSFDDLESYDIESALYALYCDKIDNYYKDYFIPDCCMDYIGEYADQALEKYR